MPSVIAGLTKWWARDARDPSAGGDGSRQPSGNELEGARFQGRLVAEVATRLAG
ncbi:hypothetical protein [Luteimonas terricola]|uniref:hypothetical protein n=1 Tax=Luteimonas terricola TaxID=645597 RepID=UPI0031BB4BB2